jgi:hypothetical protein
VGIYFRADTTRMSFRELWWLSSTIPVFLIACVRKVFRLRAPVTWAVCHDATIAVLPTDKVPPHALQALEPPVEDFQRLGAHLAFYHTVPSSKNVEGCAAILLPCERDAIIVITWARASGRKGRVGCTITSRLYDGTLLSTTNLVGSTGKPPGSQVLRWRNATPAELSCRHREALAEAASRATPVCDEEDAKEVLREGKRRKFEWNVSRGVYVLLTTAEQAQLGLSLEGNS